MKMAMRIIITFILGISTGTIIGLLSSPRTGRQNRKKLAKEFDAQKQALEEMASSKQEEAKGLVNSVIKEKAKEGKSLIDQVKGKVLAN
ncbi:MAG: gas vesicle protein [Cyclobacteriaceae bacterium]|jgi:gas vesicle protein